RDAQFQLNGYGAILFQGFDRTLNFGQRLRSVSRQFGEAHAEKLFGVTKLDASIPAVKKLRDHLNFCSRFPFCRNDHVRALAGSQNHSLLLRRIFLQSTIAADSGEGDVCEIPEVEIKKAALRGVHNAPALRRSGARLHLGILSTVDQDRIALTPE